MSNMRRTKRLVALAAGLSLVAAACGGDDDDDSDATDAPEATEAPEADRGSGRDRATTEPEGRATQRRAPRPRGEAPAGGAR